MICRQKNKKRKALQQNGSDHPSHDYLNWLLHHILSLAFLLLAGGGGEEFSC
jgi:hypothetical protein